MRSLMLISLFTLFFCTQTVYALEVPYLSGRVNDQAGILSDTAVKNLEKKLKDFEEKTSCQIVVLTIKSLEGESIEDFSIRVVEVWKLGKKGKDNGVLFMVSQSDRKMRIEIGYGLEGVLTDFAAGRIIDNEVAPFFKKNDFDGGITSGINAIIRTITSGEYKTTADKLAISPDSIAEEPVNNIDRQVFETPFVTRVLIGLFIFSVLGLFTFLMLFMKGFQGIFMYFFLIPFWGLFPIMVVGTKGDLIIFGVYLVGSPLVKLFLKHSKKGIKISKRLIRFSGGSSGSSASGSSWSSSSDSSGSSFSGGGGSFGGGGASGSW